MVLGKIKAAMSAAVKLIEAIGVPAIFTPKDGTPVDVKVMVRELNSTELVGDYKQGDLRVIVPSHYLVSVPKKYDVIEIEGRRYAVKDNGNPNRRAGDLTMTYKFVVGGS